MLIRTTELFLRAEGDVKKMIYTDDIFQITFDPLLPGTCASAGARLLQISLDMIRTSFSLAFLHCHLRVGMAVRVPVSLVSIFLSGECPD